MKHFLCLLCLSPAIFAAPAPIYKPPPPLSASIIGHWQMTWGEQKSLALYAADGFYGEVYCLRHWNGEVSYLWWKGSWSLAGERLTLRGRNLDNPDSSEFVCVVDLDKPRRGVPGITGTFNGSTRFTLEKEP